MAKAIESAYSFRADEPATLPLAKSIRSKRLDARISPNGLADMVGVSSETLQGWELGEALPSLPNLILLSNVLGLSLGDLIPQSGGLPRTIGYRILQQRLAEGLTIKEVCLRFGFPRGSYFGWEAGLSFPEARHWDRLSAWMDVDVDNYVIKQAPVNAAGPEVGSVGSHIKLRLASLDMSRAELAERVGAHKNTVGTWERDRSLPQPRYHKALSETLGLDVPQLIAAVKASRLANTVPWSLGDYIRLRRYELDIGRLDLTTLTGARDGEVRAWELGLSVPSHRYYIELTAFLGLDVDSLPPELRITKVRDSNLTLGELIRLKRKEDNLTIWDLSRRLDVTSLAVARWESDESFPKNWDNIERLSDWLGVDVMSLKK